MLKIYKVIDSCLPIILSIFTVIAIAELNELCNILNLTLKIALPSILEATPESNILQEKVINSQVLQTLQRKDAKKVDNT